MPLYQLNPRELPQVWPVVAPLLQKAIDLDPSSVTIEQVEYSVRTGRTSLLVWEESTVGITGAATVDLIDYPRERIANITLLGGRSVVQQTVFDEVCNWMRLSGATKAQCWANGSRVQLYEKMGMKATHQVMRIKL
jgi:hypothetical protein